MPKKIAIIGGGMGGLSAAYALTKKDIAKDYDITVYQMGWRLGGKCATGRGPNNRIEEHGIHGFLGSYYNALTLMHEVYNDEEWKPDAANPIPTFDDAFILEGHSFHWERHNGELKRWSSETPINAFGIPTAPSLANLTTWILGYVRVLSNLLDIPTVPRTDDKGIEIVPSDNDEIANFLDLLNDTEQVLTNRLNAEIAEKLNNQALQDGGFTPTPPLPPFDWAPINPIIDSPVQIRTASIDTFRRGDTMIEFFQVILRGVRDDDVITKGFTPLDNVNFDTWLRRHGASNALMQSPLVVATINLTFQFPNGDITLPPNMSASSYLQWTLRNVAYMKRSIYLFAAGTGETIITPLYEVLKARGVKFEFFHELVDVITSTNDKDVTEIVIQEQVKTLNGKTYQPLVPVKGLNCWPNAPLFNQLEDSGNLQNVDFEAPRTVTLGHSKTFSVGKGQDIDVVVMAIPPGAIELAAPTLTKSNTKWAQAAKKMETTATQALQIWLTKPVERLSGLGTQFFASVNFPGELHGQLDFTKYIDFEDWGSNPPVGLVYGCGVMVDPPQIKGTNARVLANQKAFETARSMLTTNGTDLLPGAASQFAISSPNSFDFELLHSGDAPILNGQNRLSTQYTRGNIYASDRYTQSPTGTKKLRINPLKPGLSNMTCAGDWVDNGLNVGSVEGAVMGGFLAAAFIHNRQDAHNVLGAWVVPADSLL